MGFFVIMAFAVGLVTISVTLGQMAQVRTETSNAADAGALAAASWIASGQNEAALIAKSKLWDAIAMVQAVYLVPFCPGDGQRAYANALLLSLHEDPALGMGPPTPDQIGPSWYFRQVADDLMTAAWNVGRREFLTAAFNNMITRYPTGPWFSDCDKQANEHCGPDWQMDLATAVKQDQEDLQSSWRTSPLTLGDLVWDTGVPTNDPRYRHHDVQFRLANYPARPPKLEMQGLQLPYFQYNEARNEPNTCPGGEENSTTCGPFLCDFVGYGVDETWPGGPVADMHRVAPLPLNPLAMDSAGHKLWDLDLALIVPGIEDVKFGVCSSRVCGVGQQWTQRVEGILPASFANGTGVVTIGVSHEVQGATGDTVLRNGVSFPNWYTKFRPVASEATARFTAAQANPPARTAKAELSQTR